MAALRGHAGTAAVEAVSEGALFAAWSFTPAQSGVELVMPDGCRDVLVVAPDDAPSRLVFTSLDDRPRAAPVQAGTRLQGYRLRPGVTLQARALAALAPEAVAASLHALVQVDAELVAALEALGTGQSVAWVASAMGVSTRSLQRLLQSRGLPVPAFWRQLGRARIAAQLLVHPVSLAELAADAGYSDQAHLTRAMRRWFGMTPQRLRVSPTVLDGLCQPGVGTWTGEQISTK